MKQFKAGDLVFISEDLNPEEYSDLSRGYENTPGWDEYMWETRGRIGEVESGDMEWGGIRVNVVIEECDDEDVYEESYIFFLKDLTPYKLVNKWRRRAIT